MLRTSVLLLFAFGFLVTWVLLADWYFDSSPEGFTPRYQHGTMAVVEQIGASLYTPAYFTRSIVERLRPSNAPIDRGPLFIASILQLWPLFLLCFRRWSALGRTSKRIVLGYCCVTGLAILVGFGFLRYSGEASFGP